MHAGTWNMVSGFPPGALGKHHHSNPMIAGSIPLATNPRSLKMCDTQVLVVPPGNPGTTELGLSKKHKSLTSNSRGPWTGWPPEISVSSGHPAGDV